MCMVGKFIDMLVNIEFFLLQKNDRQIAYLVTC